MPRPISATNNQLWKKKETTKMKHFLLFVLVVASAFVSGEYAQAQAQTQKSGPVASPAQSKDVPSLPKSTALPAPVLPVVTPAMPDPPSGVTESTSYLYPVEEGRKTRDLQLEWDELEISSMKNKDRQAEITTELRTIAQQVVTKLKIDMNLFEINAKDLKFVPKKKAAK
jgi:hypothetical protein